MASDSTPQSECDEYRMDHKKRGHAIIFNVEEFLNGRLLKRYGTESDKVAMKEMFSTLGFEKVEVIQNPDAKKMKETIKNAASSADPNIDCFVCVILSHGDKGVIEAFDDKVKLHQLVMGVCEDKCSAWKGIPKIFIVQACQGHGLMLEAGDPKPKPEETVSSAQAEATELIQEMKEQKEESEEESKIPEIPTEPDVLIAYSTVPEFVSFREGTGTWFIQAINEVMSEEETRKKHDLLSMLTEVNHRVARFKEHNSIKQMPCFHSMLSKKVFFRPKA